MAKRELEFTTRLTREDVAGVIEALIEGLKDGLLKVQKSNEVLELEVPRVVDLEVEAKIDDERAEFEIEVSWRTNRAENPDAPADAQSPPPAPAKKKVAAKSAAKPKRTKTAEKAAKEAEASVKEAAKAAKQAAKSLGKAVEKGGKAVALAAEDAAGKLKKGAGSTSRKVKAASTEVAEDVSETADKAVKKVKKVVKKAAGAVREAKADASRVLAEHADKKAVKKARKQGHDGKIIDVEAAPVDADNNDE